MREKFPLLTWTRAAFPKKIVNILGLPRRETWAPGRTAHLHDHPPQSTLSAAVDRARTNLSGTPPLDSSVEMYASLSSTAPRRPGQSRSPSQLAQNPTFTSRIAHIIAAMSLCKKTPPRCVPPEPHWLLRPWAGRCWF